MIAFFDHFLVDTNGIDPEEYANHPCEGLGSLQEIPKIGSDRQDSTVDINLMQL